MKKEHELLLNITSFSCLTGYEITYILNDVEEELLHCLEEKYDCYTPKDILDFCSYEHTKDEIKDENKFDNFLVFGFDTPHPCGGYNDNIGNADTYDGALSVICAALLDQYPCEKYQIAEIKSGKIYGFVYDSESKTIKKEVV